MCYGFKWAQEVAGVNVKYWKYGVEKEIQIQGSLSQECFRVRKINKMKMNVFKGCVVYVKERINECVCVKVVWLYGKNK